MVINDQIVNINLNGNTLCLNFMNTVHGRKIDPLEDYLFNSADIIMWSNKVDLIDDNLSAVLLSNLSNLPDHGASFFSKTIELRELLYIIFFSIVCKRKVETETLNKFNKILQQQFAAIQIVQEEYHHFKKANILPENDLNRIILPIVFDSYELLTSDKLHRIKECPKCGWLFLDTTKNGKRKWCSMEACGSNVKALEWYYRNKKNQEN